MRKEDSKNKRIHFSRAFKRNALIEFANNTKASSIILQKGSDKKYASKLLHKWKKEYYENRNLIALIYENVSPIYSKKELEEIEQNNCYDYIFQDIKKEINSK